jgi:hypothetical protein
LSRTRGFASPDYSGFAFSECFLIVNSINDQVLPSLLNQKRKSAQSSAEDERFCKSFKKPGTKKQASSLRQPGHPVSRTRSFASPDYSGFAFSEQN